MERLEVGQVGTAEMLVGTRDTAARVGSGHISVLATPVMIGLIEEAALAAVETKLPDGKQSLGTLLEVSHLAATPVGMSVTATAELVAIDGRKLRFRVVARDAQDLIGEGWHERVVVTADKFIARIHEKATATQGSSS